MILSGSRRRLSCHDQRRARRTRHALVIYPVEQHFTARLGDGGELQIRIGGDAGGQVGAKHLDAVLAAAQQVDAVARDGLSRRVKAKAGFHRMADQHLHGDHFAALCLRRQLDACGHGLGLRPGTGFIRLRRTPMR